MTDFKRQKPHVPPAQELGEATPTCAEAAEFKAAYKLWVEHDEAAGELAHAESLVPVTVSERRDKQAQLREAQDMVTKVESRLQELVPCNPLGMNDGADEFAAAKPLQRSEAQDRAVLDAIRRAGHDPQRLPRHQRGISGVKAKVRGALGCRGLWTGPKVFDKAWERLRARGEIKDEG